MSLPVPLTLKSIANMIKIIINSGENEGMEDDRIYN